MGDDEKPRGATIHFPAPKALGEAVASDHDPRTAEVLRALERARGTLVDSKGLGVSRRTTGVLDPDNRPAWILNPKSEWRPAYLTSFDLLSSSVAGSVVPRLHSPASWRGRPLNRATR